MNVQAPNFKISIIVPSVSKLKKIAKRLQNIKSMQYLLLQTKKLFVCCKKISYSKLLNIQT